MASLMRCQSWLQSRHSAQLRTITDLGYLLMGRYERRYISYASIPHARLLSTSRSTQQRYNNRSRNKQNNNHTAGTSLYTPAFGAQPVAGNNKSKTPNNISPQRSGNGSSNDNTISTILSPPPPAPLSGPPISMARTNSSFYLSAFTTPSPAPPITPSPSPTTSFSSTPSPFYLQTSSILSLPTRLAFRSLPSSVTILTVRSMPYITGTPITSNMHGMAVSSLTSVCISPFPVISFNIKRPSSTLDAIYHAASQNLPFYVNLPSQSPISALVATEFTKGDYHPPPSPLSAYQESSQEGSQTSPSKFDRAIEHSPKMELRVDGTGCYYITSIIPAIFTCEIMPEKCVHVADHDIVVARVLKVEYMCHHTDPIESSPYSADDNNPTGNTIITTSPSSDCSDLSTPPPQSDPTELSTSKKKIEAKRLTLDPNPNDIIPFQGLLYGNGQFLDWDGTTNSNLDTASTLETKSSPNTEPTLPSQRTVYFFAEDTPIRE